MQRTKGAVYEREVCARFSKSTGRIVKRHIGQARDGGNDITIPPFTVECKRRKSLKTIEGWLAQAYAACTIEAPIPIVVARSDGGQSFVIIPLDDFLQLDPSKHTSPVIDTIRRDPDYVKGFERE
jgi:hypothetical protein